jgi:hypothetical protein
VNWDRSRRSLELQKTTGLSGYARPDRVNGRHHAPMDSKVGGSRHFFQKMQPLITKGCNYTWNINPDFYKNGYCFIDGTSNTNVIGTETIFQLFLKHTLDYWAGVSSENK